MNQSQQIAFDQLTAIFLKKEGELKQHREQIQEIEQHMEALRVSIRLVKELAEIEMVVSVNGQNALFREPTVAGREILAVAAKTSGPFPAEQIRGLSQPRAMVVIAKHFGGYIRTKDLARILVGGGLMKLTKNSASIASRLIRESERFERISDGYYKLKSFDFPTNGTPQLPSPEVQVQ